MLLVKTSLSISSIHGIGLFAAQLILKGTVVWRFHPVIDIKLTGEEIARLAEPCREQTVKYTYRDKLSGLYVLCGDDARFFNHSDEPNCIDVFNDAEADLTLARRDIQEGEELTCDYALFDLDLIEGKYRL